MAAMTMNQLGGAYGMASGGPAAAFEVIHGKFLRVNLAGAGLREVWTKMGSMVGYTGEVKFERAGMLEHGLKHALKQAVTEEGAKLVRATCSGPSAQLMLADAGKGVVVLRLAGDAVVVNGNDLLAFEPSIRHDITMMRRISSLAAGGLFQVRLEGMGHVALLTHGTPLTLPVAAGLPPVFTDPQATVAWSANLACDFHTDVSFRTLLGRSSGESFQMTFQAPRGGHGFVIVQPYEEHPPPPTTSSSSSSAGGYANAAADIFSAFSG